jgi:hypothetical protein
MEKFVEVYVAPDITYAYLVKAHLENADIPVQIANENVSSVYSMDGMSPRVLVPKSRVKEAQEVIDEMRQSASGDLNDLDQDDEEDAGDTGDQDSPRP